MRAFTKRPLLVVLAVLILLDIFTLQTVFSHNKKDPSTQESTAVRTPSGVVPVTVTPQGVVSVDGSSPTPTAPVRPTPKPTSDEATSTDEGSSDSASAIEVEGSSFAGRPYETVSMQGTYAGAGRGTMLRVQTRVEGEWVDFPLPTITDESGRFTAHVELAALGEHRLRVIDPKTGTSSKTVVVVIR